MIVELTDAGRRRVCGAHRRVDDTTEAGKETIDLADLQEKWEAQLEPVFPYRKAGPTARAGAGLPRQQARRPHLRLATPRVIIPVFPGTNCEYDTARAFEQAGGEAHILVLNNLTPDEVAESVRPSWSSGWTRPRS